MTKIINYFKSLFSTLFGRPTGEVLYGNPRSKTMQSFTTSMATICARRYPQYDKKAPK